MQLLAKNLVFSLLFSLIAVPALRSSAAAELAPDTEWETRRAATLLEFADEYAHVETYTNCVQFGFATMHLLARIDAGERGLITASAASEESEILHLAQETRRLIGPPGNKGPCAWENAGSPAALHAALALGLVLHRWGDELTTQTRAALVTALESDWRDSIGPYLVNGNLSIVAGRLLAGEAIGKDSNLWQQGSNQLESIYAATMARGGLELNAPIYTAYQFTALAAMLDVEDDRIRTMAQILLEYEALVHGHLYLPGGGLGAPQSRDYSGGARDTASASMNRIIWLLTGDGPDGEPQHTVHQIGIAVSSWQLPAALRSIFLDKGDGYEFWANTDAPIGGSRFPDFVYPFGEDGSDVSPWQAVVLPNAMMGIAHGHRFQSIHVSMGVYAQAPDGRFPILYQYQPYVEGDTTETGGGMPSTGGDADPDDFVRELYDHKRLMAGRTMLSLWDPTLANKDPAKVVRTHRDTRVHLPMYEEFGGEVREGAGWYVARLDSTYVAFHPLGEVLTDQVRGGGSYRFLRLGGRSGGIYELATTEEFATIDDYLTDLSGRALSFTTSPFEISFEGLDPDSDERVPLRLTYEPERRWVDGTELSNSEALDHGLMQSRWVSWNRPGKTLSVARECYEGRDYDIGQVSITTTAPDPQRCSNVNSTIFSNVPYLGDAANFDMNIPERWMVREEDDDPRLHITSFPWSNPEKLGAVALVRARTRRDFALAFDVKTAEAPVDRPNIDFAVVFDWQDDDNYYYLLGNSTAEYTAIHAIEGGVRRTVAVADHSLLTDQNWHRVEVARVGNELVASYDGGEFLRVVDEKFSEGSIGLGSLNDSLFFDDLTLAPDPKDDSPGAEDTKTGGCGCQSHNGGHGFGALLILLAVAATRRRWKDLPMDWALSRRRG